MFIDVFKLLVFNLVLGMYKSVFSSAKFASLTCSRTTKLAQEASSMASIALRFYKIFYKAFTRA